MRLQSADDLTSAARLAHALAGGEVSFGIFSNPKVRVRIVGLNSAEVADAVREGRLEAGLVQLPIDGKNLVVSDPILTDEVVYVSAYPANTARPMTIADLAESRLILSEVHWRNEDPLRRGLIERARAAGVTLEPDIEVEFQEAAIVLAAAGVGDTLASAFVVRNAPNVNQLHFASLDPPYLEHYAFISRTSGDLSPATRRFISIARRHIATLTPFMAQKPE